MNRRRQAFQRVDTETAKKKRVSELAAIRIHQHEIRRRDKRLALFPVAQKEPGGSPASSPEGTKRAVFSRKLNPTRELPSEKKPGHSLSRPQPSKQRIPPRPQAFPTPDTVKMDPRKRKKRASHPNTMVLKGATPVQKRRQRRLKRRKKNPVANPERVERQEKRHCSRDFRGKEKSKLLRSSL